jgi:2-polyprenyl-3-methyl-5-hydroxy-6-metoxy-1,4-benzoquinol methylase
MVAKASDIQNQPPTGSRNKDAEWYDKFYKTRQTGLSPWYRFLLPELKRTLKPSTKLLELGCGQAHILRVLANEQVLPQENITGVDQSKVAVGFCAEQLPKATFCTGDLYDLHNLPPDSFDVCLLMETIEHIEEPQRPIANLSRLLKQDGLLYVSFPNFIHLPWLLVRILSEKLNRPNWIVLQPVDKIYAVFGVRRLFKRAGFRFVKGIGSNYGPPVLYPLETDSLTRALNLIGLWWLSFHPILVFRKTGGSNVKTQ